ncbi:DoxX family protein [Citricoccus muralis]|uniref:DoxX family protein n=1 Tax=Citricoccus muralis TaxID=169134 RepID=A0ABY8H940_9MICC|nr:DoxX family protein [Citricoccus muralis]WFP17173.1 DoxX family protein [Citricoccus muralis]
MAQTQNPYAQLVRTPPLVADIALLAARIALGLIMMAHGWQKLDEWGLAGTGESFEQMGVPAPHMSATIAAGVEFGGGALLILGLLTPLAGIAITAVMAGAWGIAHWTDTVFVDQGGWELVAALTVGALVIAVVGPGRLSIDALFTRRRRGR